MKQGDHVTVHVPQGDWRHRYDGCHGVVACVYSSGRIDVDLGPEIVAFRPGQVS